MADFWIKIEKSTPDKPEIFELAEILGIDPDAVLGKLIRVWCWLDSQSENGHIKSVTSVLIDRLTMSEGFADAMKTVGWLDDDCVPNFDRHLGDNAKKRAKDAERKRKSRTLSEKCHTKSVTESGLDKSRVDKIINNNIPPKSPKGGKVEWEDNYIDLFWSEYPKKTDKKKSMERLKKMIRTNPDKNHFQIILERVKQKAAVTDKKFWPSPERYLRDELWNDEIINYTGENYDKQNNSGNNKQRECFADTQKRHAQMLMARFSEPESNTACDASIHEDGRFIPGQVQTAGIGDP